MDRLVEIARQRGVKRLAGLVLRENAPMLQLAQELGFTATARLDSPIVEVALDL
jgi:acetyltransferase